MAIASELYRWGPSKLKSELRLLKNKKKILAPLWCMLGQFSPAVSGNRSLCEK